MALVGPRTLNDVDLRRFPDVEGPGLVAIDAADRLTVDEAAALLDEVAPTRSGTVVIDDAYGALTLSLLDVIGGDGEIRVHQDLLTGQRALIANAERLGVTGFTSVPFSPDAVSGARLVVMRLPRSLDRLAEVAALIASHADPGVVVVAGGRIKHMTPRMNDVLREYFDRLDVTHARQKSRVLIARNSSTDRPIPTWPHTEFHPDLDLTVAAHGGVFAGTGVDIGTRFLLANLPPQLPLPRLDPASPTGGAGSRRGSESGTKVVDLGCGNGTVSAWFARHHRDAQIVAVDRSALAVASTRATAVANGVDGQVDVHWADGAEPVPDGSADIVLLNPPFHSDAALSTGIAQHLFAEAARVLRPGGKLWCVWNSHLRYRPALRRIVGPTRQIARNPKFTVTASTREA